MDRARRQRGRADDRAGTEPRRCDRTARIDFVPDIGGWIPIPYNFDFLIDGTVAGGIDRKFQLRDRYIVDLAGDHDKRVDRRLVIALAIGLDALQNR